MQWKQLFLILLIMNGLSWFSTWAQVEKDVSDRIELYKADKSIDFVHWPKQGKLVYRPPDLSNTLAYFSTNTSVLKSHESSQVGGMKYERVIYRTWRKKDSQKEELAVWVTVMESVGDAHNYLLSRWANVSAPSPKHTKGTDVGLGVGDVCFVISYPSGGIQVAWFIRANVVVEIRASGSFVTQTPNLVHVVDDSIRALTEKNEITSRSSTNEITGIGIGQGTNGQKE